VQSGDIGVADAEEFLVEAILLTIHNLLAYAHAGWHHRSSVELRFIRIRFDVVNRMKS
jgi:hypothetical protein